jgi:hypothetical protein
MKIRSVTELFDFVCDETSWRRKELSDLWMATESRNANESAVCRRSFVVLALGHWEGGVRRMAQAYLTYACFTCTTLDELRPSFMSFLLSKELASIRDGDSLAAASLLAERIDSWRQEAAAISADAVHTGGNLSPKRLRAVCKALALPYDDKLAVRENFIDQSLKQRHDIAHGDRLPVDREDVVAIHNGIDVMLDVFASLVVDSAMAKTFLR